MLEKLNLRREDNLALALAFEDLECITEFVVVPVQVHARLRLGRELAAHDSVDAALASFMAHRFERARIVVENSVRIGTIEMTGGDQVEANRMLGGTLAALQKPY